MTIVIPTLQTERLLLLPPSAAAEALYGAFYTDAQASHAYGGPLTAAAAWNRLAADLGAWHAGLRCVGAEPARRW